jgi:hypothetical protein
VKGWCRIAVIACLAAGGCNEQFADPIRGEHVPDNGDPEDPCSAWATEEECRADVNNACSVQPSAVGCRSHDPTCAPIACRGGDPFVRRTGASLTLRGQPYRFSGANSWGVAYAPDGCRISEIEDPELAAERTFDDMAELGIDVLRVWAFQSYAGASGRDYAAFERLVAHARRAGVRLVFVLENQHSDCTEGGRDDEWFRTGYTAPYGAYALSYVDYVDGVVEHFRDEPTILAWELLHEAGSEDFAALNAFVQQMSTRIRVTDSNHLIAAGIDNGHSSATENEGPDSNYAALHAHPTIDLLDVHDFDDAEEPLNGDQLANFEIARALGKPAMVGAVAVVLTDGSGGTLVARAELLRAKLDAAYEHGFAGALVYDYYPDWMIPGYSFDSRPADPLGGRNGVVARASARFRGARSER